MNQTWMWQMDTTHDTCTNCNWAIPLCCILIYKDLISGLKNEYMYSMEYIYITWENILSTFLVLVQWQIANIGYLVSFATLT